MENDEPKKPQIEDNDFSELPMLAQKHLKEQYKNNRAGLLADGDSIGKSNSNPASINGSVLDPNPRMRGPRGSAAPSIITKVRE